MKKLLGFILISFLTVFIITSQTSCKKDKNDAVSIIGKWTYSSGRERETSTNPAFSPTDNTTPAPAGEYLELKSDGTFFEHTLGGDYSGPYTYANNKLVFDGDIYDVTLAANVLILTWSETFASNGYEYTIVWDDTYTR